MNSPAQSPTRHIVDWFANEMEAKLTLHREKGGPDKWRNERPEDMLGRILDEWNELHNAILTGDPVKIAAEAADVANFAMIVADIFNRPNLASNSPAQK